MSVKFSQIASGGAVNAATDTTLAVRNGTTDVLVVPVDLSSAQAFTGQKTFSSVAAAGTAPAVAGGTGAGTSPTITVGKDNAGTISVTTGATPAANAIVATVTFNKAFANGSTVVLTPADATTAAVMAHIFATGSAASWTLNTVAALITLTTYNFNYHVIGN